MEVEKSDVELDSISTRNCYVPQSANVIGVEIWEVWTCNRSTVAENLI